MKAKTPLSSSKHTHRFLMLLVSLTAALVVSIPQILLIVDRGSEWNGSYAILDYDELTYSAYVNGLINGQPRRFNPFQLPDRAISGENYFSIQFLPAYAVALPGRVLGIDTSTAFIVLLPLMTAVSAMAVFLLLKNITEDTRLSAVGVLLVLLCGRLVSENPLAAEQLYASFAFARRYTPAIPFPFFFLFCLCTWRAIRGDRRACILWSLLAGICFNVLLFSYFYLWTAAASWLVSFLVIWLVFRVNDRRRIALHLLTACVVGASGLIPYFVLLTRRANTLDIAQALINTRAPDLFRVTEVVAFAVLAALIFHWRRGRLDLRSPSAILCVSYLVLPFVVFNQQIITGKTLQPFHYEQFIVNYVLLTGLVIAYQLVWRNLRIRLALWVMFALSVGFVTSIKDGWRKLELNIPRDQAETVFKKLNRLAASDGCNGYALFNQSLLAASAPTSLSIPPLWAPNLYTHATISPQEDLERLFQFFFYLGVTHTEFKKELEQNIQLRAAVFGLPRVNKTVSKHLAPISAEEIDQQAKDYAAYSMEFSTENADKWPLCYVVTIGHVPYDLSGLARWYYRDAGEHIGGSILYRLERKSGSTNSSYDDLAPTR